MSALVLIDGIQHLRALASTPRLAGSRANAEARAYCARELARLEFSVAERSFGYSQFPARLATPCAGVWGALSLAIAGVLARNGSAGASVAVSLIALAILGVTGSWLARRGVLEFPGMRREGTNLEAVRGAGVPNVWLVAHTDTKSQLVPMLGRVTSVVVLATSWLAMMILTTITLGTGHHFASVVWGVVAGVGSLAALGITATVVGNRSPGAVDNASGVAVVLAAAELLPRDVHVGILITDAEEMGLGGARSAARTLARATAINVDGVDDQGALSAMYSGSRPASLLRTVSDAAAAEQEPLKLRRLIPGVLVDGLAFADAGWEVVTLSRGTARTLRRIHTQSDSLDHMTGAGIPITARVVSRIVQELA